MCPAIEKAWQGKPANIMSCDGIWFSGICVISPCGTSLKFVMYVLTACLSISDENTQAILSLNAFSNPRRIPPIPANKSIIRILLLVLRLLLKTSV